MLILEDKPGGTERLWSYLKIQSNLTTEQVSSLMLPVPVPGGYEELLNSQVVTW